MEEEWIRMVPSLVFLFYNFDLDNYQIGLVKHSMFSVCYIQNSGEVN